MQDTPCELEVHHTVQQPPPESSEMASLSPRDVRFDGAVTTKDGTTTAEAHDEDIVAETKGIFWGSWASSIFFWFMVAVTTLHVAFGMTPLGNHGWGIWDYSYVFFFPLNISFLCAKSSPIYKYLSNIDDDQHIRQFVNGLREIPVEIWWSVRCFHSERC